jgi:ectoine hydroxylase-related dioxygenase (phytanoyl-CoA dioxygenase family)
MLPEGWEVDWAGHGFLVTRGLVERAAREALLARAWDLARLSDGPALGTTVVRHEQGLPGSLAPEERISKLYRLHRAEHRFRRCFGLQAVTEVLGSVIGPDVDLFLSQVVFKLPGAVGQPWHQDASIFPFEPPPGPVVGVWCALTDATGGSSRLGIVRASHRSGLRSHGRDPAHPAVGRYVALLDQDVSEPEFPELCSGDAVFLHSALVHSSTDNRSREPRVAATAHFAPAGTVDRTQEVWGQSIQ